MSTHTNNDYTRRPPQPIAHNISTAPALQSLYPLFARSWAESDSTQADNIGVFQQDEGDDNSSMSSLLERPTESDYEDSDNDYDTNDLGFQDDACEVAYRPHHKAPDFDNISDSGTEVTPKQIPRISPRHSVKADGGKVGAQPLYLSETSEMQVEAVSLGASPTLKQPAPLTPNTAAAFSITHIRIPRCSPTTPQASPTHQEVDPEVRSKHQQVLASWKAIFGQVHTTPGTTVAPEAPQATEHHPKRSHQQRLPEIEKDRNKPHGDLMQQKKPGYSRAYFINPSGISYHRGLLDFAEILQSLRDNDIDVFGLSEMNVDVRKPEVRKQCEDLVAEWYGNSLFASSTSTLPSKNPYKPGDTCMGITNELCGRYQTSGSDPKGLGRWSFIKMYRKDGNSLVVITGYRVCDASLSTVGASTAFHQQCHLLRMAGNKTPNPRKQFMTDLTVEILKWQN
jgi:hypothetical protein